MRQRHRERVSEPGRWSVPFDQVGPHQVGKLLGIDVSTQSELPLVVDEVPFELRGFDGAFHDGELPRGFPQGHLFAVREHRGSLCEGLRHGSSSSRSEIFAQEFFNINTGKEMLLLPERNWADGETEHVRRAILSRKPLPTSHLTEGVMEEIDPRIAEILSCERINAAVVLAFQIVGTRHDAEDAVQNAVLAFLTKLDQIPADASPWPWFRGFVHRNALRIRAARYKRKRRVQTGTDAVESFSEEALSELAGLIERETQQRLETALAQMRPVQREAVLLRYYEGLDCRTIAETLKIPKNTARVRVHRGLRQLAAILQVTEAE